MVYLFVNSTNCANVSRIWTQLGSILESKGICATFQENGKKGEKCKKKRQKRAKNCKFGQKCTKSENILKKGR